MSSRRMTVHMLTVSVVSHGQNALVNALLRDLSAHCSPMPIVITENIPDAQPLALANPPHAVKVLSNKAVAGFGANHNSAFRHCDTPFFCVVNPDVRIASDPFPALITELERPGAAVVGPLVRDPLGCVQDSARIFPSLRTFVSRARAKRSGPDYPTQRPVDVDWIADMFMLFRAEAFRAVGGFDENYFMYYEDADICRRLRARGMRTRYVPTVEIVHDARRGSHRNPKLAMHHAASIFRFLRT